MRLFVTGRLGWRLLLGLMVVLLLAGCGGGGSSSLTAPNNPALQYGANAFTPNYVPSLNALYWWSSFPVKIAFTNDLALNGASVQPAIRTGINAWMGALGNKISYTWVTDPKEAQITVDIELLPSPATSGEEIGKTDMTYRTVNNQLVSAATVIYVWNGMDAARISHISHTAAHEMGHALGISGHSPDAADVMYAYDYGNIDVQLTQRDLNTMKTLYAQLWLGSKAQPVVSSGPVKTVTVY